MGAPVVIQTRLLFGPEPKLGTSGGQVQVASLEAPGLPAPDVEPLAMPAQRSESPGHARQATPHSAPKYPTTPAARRAPTTPKAPAPAKEKLHQGATPTGHFGLSGPVMPPLQGVLRDGTRRPSRYEDYRRYEAEAAVRRRDFARHIAAGGSLGTTPAHQPYAPPPSRGPVRVNENFTRENAQALKQTAANIGADPHHLAMVMAHETIGSFSPRKWGGERGRYMGLIQFGPHERARYGANEGQSFKEQLPAVERYLKDRGYKPGMGLADLYSTVLAGRPGLYKRRDKNGSVEEHVRRMQRERGAQATRFLESGSGATPSSGSGGVTPQSIPSVTTAGR